MNENNFIFKDQIHFYQRVRENEKVFGDKTRSEIIKECLGKLNKNNEVAIIQDGRLNKYSNQVRIFKTEANGLVAIPCYERDDGYIEILTLINTYSSENQTWFVNNYNNFAKENGLKTANYRF